MAGRVRPHHRRQAIREGQAVVAARKRSCESKPSLSMPGMDSERGSESKLRLSAGVAHVQSRARSVRISALKSASAIAAKHCLIDCRPRCSGACMDTSRATESFRDLLLRHRGRTGLTQLELAGRVGAGRRTVPDWEAGINPPTAERLKAMIQAP